MIHYADRQNQFAGVGVIVEGATKYILLHFDGYELIERVNVQLDGYPAFMRGVYIDGYMYMFGTNDYKVEQLFD